jgi:hypothetical protein
MVASDGDDNEREDPWASKAAESLMISLLVFFYEGGALRCEKKKCMRC